MHVLAKMEGLSTEPAAAVAFAGLFKLVRSGLLKPGDTIVVNCTGHTMPAEEFILGTNWSRNVEFPAKVADTPQDGLLSALNQVAPNRFRALRSSTIPPTHVGLIRRILQSQGDYTIYEATNGKEGLEVIRRESPDLIILDLMMPEVDGFAVLDALKADQDTAQIPVIVTTAKELTPNEKDRLGTQIQALMQKGDFLNDEFLQEVKAFIK